MNINWQQHLSGKYHTFQKIGQGSFAEVFKATQVSDQQFVAIKVISLQVHNHPSLLKLFQEEIKYLRTLQGDSIVTLIDIVNTKDHIMIITELCECDLQQLQDKYLRYDIEYPKFNLKTTAMIVEQIAIGIKRMHEQNVMHRDIKPQNILIKFQQYDDFDRIADEELDLELKLRIVEDGLRDGKIRIKLTDFGLSKEYQRTMVNSIAGSPPFMSPQIINGSPYNYMADVYSLFVTFWKLITGIHPVPISTDLKIMESKIKSGSFFGENKIQDQNLKQFLKKGLSYEVNDRPKIDDLLEYLNGILKPVDNIPSYYKHLQQRYIENTQSNLNFQREQSNIQQVQPIGSRTFAPQSQHILEQQQSAVNQRQIIPQIQSRRILEKTVYDEQQRTYFQSLHNALNPQNQNENQVIEDFAVSFQIQMNSLEILSELYEDFIEIKYISDHQKFSVAYNIECQYNELIRSLADVKEQNQNAQQGNLAILNQLQDQLAQMDQKYKYDQLLKGYESKAEELFEQNNDLLNSLHTIHKKIRTTKADDVYSQSAYLKLESGMGEL